MVVGVSSNGRVPSALPPILKTYTKAAIRTQPRDLIAWSYAYFQSLADGESPPAKEQLEFPLPQTESGISPGLIRVLHKKLSSLDAVPRPQFDSLCQALGIKDWAVNGTWELVGDEEVTWDKLFVALVTQETKSVPEQLNIIMQSVAEDIVTKEVPVETVLKYFDLIHSTDDDPADAEVHEEIKEYLQEIASYQDGTLVPSDLSRPSCPLKKLDN